VSAQLPQPGGDGSGASWRALSGDLPPVPSFDAPAAAAAHHAELPQQPVAGGWTQPWQDQQGQWHYPFADEQPEQQPPYPGASEALAEPQPVQVPQDLLVPAAQLAPVAEPRYLAPQRAVRDPRQRTMAAVITFVALLIGLWGILGFMGSLSATLTSINSGNAKLKLQMVEANRGLADLDSKTSPLERMAADSEVLAASLGGIEQDMGSMLEGVDAIAANMEQMSGHLATLDSELGEVNAINEAMAEDLGSIEAGLAAQRGKVQGMRRDVQATGQVLGSLPPRLAATNGRLAHVNRAVDIMGCRGITNNLKVKIGVGPLPTGSAEVFATVIPPRAWGMQPDGVTPC
jgi:hypothetical protein